MVISANDTPNKKGAEVFTIGCELTQMPQHKSDIAIKARLDKDMAGEHRGDDFLLTSMATADANNTSNILLPEPEELKPSTADTSSASTDKLVPGRYLDNGDGTITDTKTKLIWKKCSEGQSGNDCSRGTAKQYMWDEARNTFGKGNWRLPTKEELNTLVYCSNGTPTPLRDHKGCSKDKDWVQFQQPTINLQVFPNTLSYFYWSSSPVAGFSGYAWGVGFNHGGDDWSNKNNAFQVRLVRSGH